MNNIEDLFIEQGGVFVTSSDSINEKLPRIKAFIFDWDGVFNDSYKRDATGSPFSEADSMGLNMLRFSYYLKFGFIPKIFVITGENNQPALILSRREKFNGVYLKVKHKLDALKHINNDCGLNSEEISFAFDDILDLGLAKSVGLRFMVQRNASPLLSAMVIKNGWTDYFTANTGGQHAVREISELIIGLNGNFESVISNRIDYSDSYQTYLQERNANAPLFFTGESGEIAPLNMA